MRTCKVCGKTKEDTDFYGKIYTCKRCVCEHNSRLVRERNLRKHPDLPDEVWKPYIGDTRYSVSTLGRVRGQYAQLLSPKKHWQGYLWLHIGCKHCLVHRLVAETFIPNPDNKATVNHINANKSDNRIENLEWATQSENNRHALKLNLRYFTRKMWETCTKGHKLSKRQVKDIKDKYDAGIQQFKLADEYKVSRAQICRIINGKSRNSKYQIKQFISNQQIKDL